MPSTSWNIGATSCHSLFLILVSVVLSSFSSSGLMIPFQGHPCKVTTTGSITTLLFSTMKKQQGEEFPIKVMKNDIVDSSYYKGGNARYQNPLVIPSRMGWKDEDNNGEECESIMIDFATGDELCWGEAPMTPKNYVSRESSPPVNTAAQHYYSAFTYYQDMDDVDVNYYKGGDAHYQASKQPRRLDDDEEDCEGENRFIDFATGDELCWP